MRLFSLTSFICSSFCLAGLWAGSGSVEFKAGLMPFTITPVGAIRTYYNDDSSIQGISYYNGDGFKYATQDWQYDEFSRVRSRTVAEQISWFFINNSVFTYTYDDNNQLEETRQTYIKGSRNLKYEYNSKGSVDKIQAYDTYLGLFTFESEAIENSYAANGKLACKTFFGDNNERVLIQKWTYDEMDRLKNFLTFDGEGDLIWATEYTYAPSDTENEQTLPSLETTVGPHHEVISYVINRPYQGNLLKERCVCDAQGELITRTLIEYNERYQPTHLYDTDKDDLLIGAIHTYYDKQERPYQHDFRYQDRDIFRERIQSYLELPSGL